MEKPPAVAIAHFRATRKEQAEATMRTVAYIANQFPAASEPYVADEIRELRRHGVNVLPCSVRQPGTELDDGLPPLARETLILTRLRPGPMLQACGLLASRLPELADLLRRVLLRGKETPRQRLRALLQTWLGAYLAAQLKPEGVQHIHAHHGYGASWAAMVAARLLGAGFSMTLHGSDLLLHAPYLDSKLRQCRFCLTVSQFNRRQILERYPEVEPGKIVVQRLGVASPAQSAQRRAHQNDELILLAVGRLHPVKDHAFLIRACRELKDRGVRFLCLIAGEGPERAALESLLPGLDLEREVRLLGHLSRQELAAHYRLCDLVVLTSRSEGLPLVLMEAMAYGRVVLAPEITGIPELIEDGRSGFLYRPGSLNSLVSRVEMIGRLRPVLGTVQRQARQRVQEDFNREKNLAVFAELFLALLGWAAAELPHENPVLQQI